MLTHETILKLPDPLLREACALAKARDLSVGQIVRDALAAELRRAKRRARTRAKTREAEIAPIRADLAIDLADARDWPDLRARFAAKGFALKPSGSGLAVYRVVGDKRVCAASDLGPGYGALVDRFGPPPAPGRARPQIAETPEDDLLIDF